LDFEEKGMENLEGGLYNRKMERALLMRAWAIVAVGGLLLQMAQGFERPYIAIIIGMALPMAFVLVHVVFCLCHMSCDELILPILSLLVGLGLLELYRLRPATAMRQLIWVGLGLMVMLAVMGIIRREFIEFERYKYICGVGAIFLLIITLLFGQTLGGARAWLSIGPISFEPSEVVKILLVIFMAGFLNENSALLARPNMRYFGPVFLFWGVALLLLVFQRDLGAAVLFYGTFLAMVYVATGSLLPVATGIGVLVVGGYISYLLFDHVKVRVAIWREPWATATGTGYQMVQSLFAMGSGGFFGSGLGKGSPWLIPAAHTDFLFIALHEEMGLLGAVGLMVAYLILLQRGFKISLETPDKFEMLLAAGLTSALALQVVTIVGGVTGFMPLTGVTLPFLSYGGTSMMANFIIIGLLLGLSDRGQAEEGLWFPRRSP
jgi:cell division protein FtsW (lipid II flippase)